MKPVAGLLDRVPFPDNFSAYVVEPTDDPRVHGYTVQSDLSRHVGPEALTWLALMGELPTAAEHAALAAALVWLAPLHVGEGPAHAAVLARMAGTPDESLPAVVTVALGQLIAAEVATLTPLFHWLASDRRAPVPEIAVASSPEAGSAAAYAWMAAESVRWFGPERALPLGVVLTRVATAYAVLALLGVTDLPRLLALSSWARLPLLLAEARHHAVGAVMTYPTHVPPYQYEEAD